MDIVDESQSSLAEVQGVKLSPEQARDCDAVRKLDLERNDSLYLTEMLYWLVNTCAWGQSGLRRDEGDVGVCG